MHESVPVAQKQGTAPVTTKAFTFRQLYLTQTVKLVTKVIWQMLQELAL